MSQAQTHPKARDHTPQMIGMMLNVLGARLTGHVVWLISISSRNTRREPNNVGE